MKIFQIKKLTLVLTFTITALAAQLSWSQKTQLKFDDIQAEQDTSITIKKGSKIEKQEPDFEVVTGNDEIIGDEEFDDKKALASWKEACDSWKKEIRELNTENKVIFLSCGSRKKSKEKEKTTYESKASYKIRVRIREASANPPSSSL